MNLLTTKKSTIKGKKPLPKPKISIKSTFKLLWIYLSNFKKWLWAELAVTFLVVLIGVGGYFAMQYAIVALQDGKNDIVMAIGGILIGLFCFMWGCTYAQYSILVHVGLNVGEKIRKDIFAKVQKLPIRFFDTHNSGDLMSRFTNDVNAITTMLAENMTDVIASGFWTIGMGIVMFVISPYLSILSVVLLPLFMIVTIVLVKKSQPIFVRQQMVVGTLNGFLEEYLSGQNIIDLYSQGDEVMQQYKKIINDIQEVAYKSQLYSGLMVPWGSFMTGFISLFICVIGIIFIVTDVGLGGVIITLTGSNTNGESFENPEWASQFASLTIYLVLLKFFVQPFSQISNVLNIFQAALAGANRAFDVFDENNESNSLENLVINIAGSNLSIEEQKAILSKKLTHYEKRLSILGDKIHNYPKLIKSEMIRDLNSWIIHIQKLLKTFHKYYWTTNIYKIESDLTVFKYEKIQWFKNELLAIKEDICSNFVNACETYEYFYNLLKAQAIFVYDKLPNDPKKATLVIDEMLDQIEQYLSQQLINQNYLITQTNLKSFNKFKRCLRNLENERNKIIHFMQSNFNLAARNEIIKLSKLSAEDKNDEINIHSFYVIATKMNIMLRTILSYCRYHLFNKVTINNEDLANNPITENDKKELRQMFDNTLADYHMTIKSLVMFENKKIHDINANINFDHLTFSYDGLKNVLKDINLEVKAGQTIAIVGPTGSGKSTIINLLTKFYDIEHGDINFEDLSIREITRESLRRNISIVLQDTYLFAETIKENIRFGNLEASDEMIVEAAKMANCHEFIMNLPHGYDTVLESNGEGLSQGQKQLLAIARAILSPSSVLILDEATSSIDTKTEKDIQLAMERLMHNKTTFMIAHRLSTVRNATKIIVLKDGEIIEAGNHEELLAIDNGFYAKLFNSQFGDDLDIETD